MASWLQFWKGHTHLKLLIHVQYPCQVFSLKMVTFLFFFNRVIVVLFTVSSKVTPGHWPRFSIVPECMGMKWGSSQLREGSCQHLKKVFSLSPRLISSKWNWKKRVFCQTCHLPIYWSEREMMLFLSVITSKLWVGNKKKSTMTSHHPLCYTYCTLFSPY